MVSVRVQTGNMDWLSGDVAVQQDARENDHWQDRDGDARSGDPQVGQAVTDSTTLTDAREHRSHHPADQSEREQPDQCPRADRQDEPGGSYRIPLHAAAG